MSTHAGRVRIDTRPRTSGLDRGVLAGCSLAVTGVGVVVGLAGTGAERWALIAALGIITPLPLIYRALQAKFDVFEPINLFVMGIFVLFVIRPICELAFHFHAFGSYSDLAGFNGALLIALLGTAGLYAGYALALGRWIGGRIPAPPDHWEARAVGRRVSVLILIGALLFLAFAVQSGQGLGGAVNFFSGRTDNGINLQRSSAYLYLGPYVTIPSTTMLLLCWQRERRARWLVGTVISGMIALLITVPRGDRTYILAFLMPLILLHYLTRGRRPKLANVLILIAILIPALNVIINVRNTSQRHDVGGQISAAFTSPLQQFKKFMLGPDTAMFSVLSLTYEVVPHDLPYKPGRATLATLAAPLPGLLVRSKPLDGQSVVYDYLFYQQAAITRSGNASGWFGSSYYDSGFIGVIVYSLLTGIVARGLWEWWRVHSLNGSAHAILAATLPLAIVLQRGAVSDTVARSSFLILPMILVFWLAGRRAPSGANA